MTIAEFLPLLRKVRRVRRGEWMALCTAHPDKHPSLSIKEGRGGRILLICRSHQCSAESICRALGLKLSDLFADNKLSPADRINLAKARRQREIDADQLAEERRSQRRKAQAWETAANLLFEKMLVAEGTLEADELAQLWHKALDKMREAEEKNQSTGKVDL